MAYYLSEHKEADAALQEQVLTELARYVHRIDAFGHPVTVHPTGVGREQVADPGVLDFDMLQTGHGGLDSLPNTWASITRAVAAEPRMPALNGEVSYEGILEGSRQEVQRLMFWCCVLSGAAGHTYGANGIWQLNEVGRPFGPSPHGLSWGDTPWQEAYQLPGSAHVAVGKRLLARYPWWRLRAHPEWVEPHAAPGDERQPYCAGIPGELRIFYFPSFWTPPVVKQLEAGVSYQATYFNPSTGEEHPLGEAAADAQGDWTCPKAPVARDWVLVMERPG